MQRLVGMLLALAACSDSPAKGWMASVDDGTSLAALSIPGTHDSGAMFEPFPGLAKCQSLTIADQLAAGVRYFDIRCHHFQDQFLIYHGSIDQNQSFDDVLATMLGFLDKHPTETIIVSVKEEGTAMMPVKSFEATFASYLDQARDRWYLDSTVPALGAVRGKLVLLRRFDAAASPLGIDASPWPDNASFAIAHPGVALQVEDEYMVTTNDAKWAAITKNLDAAGAGDPATLFLTYTSGYQTIQGAPNITSVSDDIDARLDGAIAAAHGRLGVLAIDYVTKARAQAIAALNP